MYIRKNFAPAILAFSVVALALGGYGGSLQISRLLLLLLWPVILIKVANLKLHAISFFQQQIILFVCLLLALSTISLIWSIDRNVSAGYILVLAINVTPLLLIGLLTGQELTTLKRILPRAWLVSAAIVLPLAFYEIYSGNHFSLGLDERGGGGVSALLPYASVLHGNFNDFSLFLVLCLFALSYFPTSLPSGEHRLLVFIALVTALSISLIIAINSSRAVILTTVGLLLAHLFTSKNALLVVRNLGILAGIFIIFASAMDADASLYEYLMLKFTDFSSDLEGNEGRLAVFVAGLDGFISTFGMGSGAGTSSVMLGRNPQILIPNPHNLFLEWALNFGIFGLTLFILLLVYLWRAISQNCNQLEKSVGRAFILLLPLMGIAQSHLTGYTYFWLALTTVIAYGVPVRKRLTTLKNSTINEIPTNLAPFYLRERHDPIPNRKIAKKIPSFRN